MLANYQALYQQNPAEGGLPRITPKHFPSYGPDNLSNGPRVMSVDPGEQQGLKNSYSVVQLWQVTEKGYFLEALFRARLPYDELKSLCRNLSCRYRPSAILIEEMGMGIALLDELKRHPWQEIVSMRPRESKVERLRRHATVICDRKILLPPNAPWRDDFVDELTSFPHGKFSDQVDATTQFLEYMASNPTFRQPPRRAIGQAALATNPQGLAPNRAAKDPLAPGVIQVARPSLSSRYRW